MKATHTFTVVLLFFLAGMAFSSCSGKKICLADNPTDKEISFELDGKQITVAANELKKLDEISKGKHSLKAIDGKQLDFEVTGNVMLNPASEIYVVAKQDYGAGSISNLKDTTIQVDGKTFSGPFQLKEGAAIYVGDLNYFTNEKFPNTITTSGNGDVVRKKIFRKKDFIQEYK